MPVAIVATAPPGSMLANVPLETVLHVPAAEPSDDHVFGVDGGEHPRDGFCCRVCKYRPDAAHDAFRSA
jgi:hypothetical protein